MTQLEKTYDPKSFEDRIYAAWEADGDFVADAQSEKPAYTIVMPPPNVTGQLHMGHALVSTLQDILIRWKRMSGYEVLWLPGTDHASISTEAKVKDKLAAQGLTKQDVGRERFLEEAWDWTREYGGTIRKQLRKMGVSCDWSRERFTMDEGLSHVVFLVFEALYKEGKIYRGDRIVNWCPDCGTAISDAEVDHIEEEGHLWYIRYPFTDGSGSMMIATTRPETLLGDLAVAVNPEDERFKDVVGKTLTLPLVGREIPVIADAYVDMEYGTGCVKITPSHDPNDFEVGARHDLGQCVVINNDATIAEGYAPYSGLDRYEARKRMVKDLEEQGLLDHVETLSHAVGHCSRSGTVIEPLLSKQWFVAMDEYIKGAKEALESGALKLVPERFSKIYMNWIDNIHDWTISRQLWWGHRIPVWYCHDCGEVIVSEHEPQACPKCGSHHLHQDPDTLDTWFSSALWPFSTLGWPEETEDMQKFYPTDVLVTGYDIIFFWVIRMVFSAMHFTGQSPFHHVYFNGLVRDELGRKMSKSLGNGVDPLDVIDQYGADALRYTLVTGNSPGNDTRFSEKRVEASRNFANKLWNATRFVLLHVDPEMDQTIREDSLQMEDRWILSALNTVEQNVNRNLDAFEIGLAAREIYDFTWFSFCDWYIEMVKERLYGDDEEAKRNALAVLLHVIRAIVRLLHPIMPFITEEIWAAIPKTEGKIIHAPYPTGDDTYRYPDDEAAITMVIGAITAIRNERQSRDVAPGRLIRVIFQTDDATVKATLETMQSRIMTLARAEAVTIEPMGDAVEDAATIVQEQLKIYLPLKGLVDFAAEVEKLSREKERVEGEIARLSKKLSNEGFTFKAPAAVVDKEREKLAGYQGMLPDLEKAIAEAQRLAEA
ncbi:MAG: valine--tRNA ligase [Peptoniphilaceae bacterium]|nr:valine--tRNA ligase [Peptoniphilaceae bacterium]